jgi:hypothetical protein
MKRPAGKSNLRGRHVTPITKSAGSDPRTISAPCQTDFSADCIEWDSLMQLQKLGNFSILLKIIKQLFLHAQSSHNVKGIQVLHFLNVIL